MSGLESARRIDVPVSEKVELIDLVARHDFAPNALKHLKEFALLPPDQQQALLEYSSRS